MREHELFAWGYECVWGTKDPSTGVLEAVEKEELLKSINIAYAGKDKIGVSSRL